MKILHLNKFAYSKGGAEEYMLRLAAEQSSRGDDVWVFGSNPSLPPESGVQAIDYPVIDFHAARGLEKARAVKEVMWSKRAQAALRHSLDQVKPDVVHLHNYAHQLSSSILDSVSASGARSVHTAHDYKLVCPAYVATRRDADCFACAKRISPKLIRDRCHHGSLAWSGLVAAEALLVRTKKLVPDAIVAPSEFMRDSLAASWMGAADISMVRNPAESQGLRWHGGGPLLYVGRLSREKGVESLIETCLELGVELDIAGDGPLRGHLEDRANGARVNFHGHISQERLAELREGCMAQVTPSQWPENAPLSVLESIVDGVPVIATRRGGLPEFAQLGARVALVNGVTPNELETAIAELESIGPDLELLRSTLSWGSHLRSLDLVYGGN